MKQFLQSGDIDFQLGILPEFFHIVCFRTEYQSVDHKSVKDLNGFFPVNIGILQCMDIWQFYDKIDPMF